MGTLPFGTLIVDMLQPPGHLVNPAFRQPMQRTRALVKKKHFLNEFTEHWRAFPPTRHPGMTQVKALEDRRFKCRKS